jgi:hypothetical protein
MGGSGDEISRSVQMDWEEVHPSPSIIGFQKWQRSCGMDVLHRRRCSPGRHEGMSNREPLADGEPILGTRQFRPGGPRCRMGTG